MIRKLILATSFVLLAACETQNTYSHTSASSQACIHPWVYFDLGETLIHTADEGIFFNGEALAYLTSLHDKGYPIGFLTNVPDEWGRTPEEKLVYLQNYTSDHWGDTQPFPWEWFDTRAHVSIDNARRKPHPHLFQVALTQAQQNNCPAIFQGETPEEIKAAELVGLKAYQVGKNDRPYFLPENEIDQILGQR